MDSFGSRLRRCREKKALTQKELGKHVGMSAQKISNIERGYTTGLGTDDIVRLATFLDTTPDYLVSGKTGSNNQNEKYTSADNDYIFITGKNGVRKKIPVPAEKVDRFIKLIEAGLPELFDDDMNSDL